LSLTKLISGWKRDSALWNLIFVLSSQLYK